MVLIMRDRVQDLIGKGHDAPAGEGGGSGEGLQDRDTAPRRGRGRRTCSSRPCSSSLTARRPRDRDAVLTRSRPGLQRAEHCRCSGVCCCVTQATDHASAGRRCPAATAAAAATARSAAPIDLTGYWVSVVTRRLALAHGHAGQGRLRERADHARGAEDRRRLGSGERRSRRRAVQSLRRAGDHGGASPLHITWQDDNTLKVETDAGMQTRLFQFGDWKPQGGAAVAGRVGR